MISLKQAEKELSFTKELVRLDEQPQFLWHDSYYDGPLSGICIYNDKEHWFKMVKEFDYKEEEDGKMETFLGRVYVIAELPKQQFAIMKYAHELFRKYVGTHTDYNEDNKRSSGCLEQSSWNKYYNWAKKEYKHPDLSENKVVAWWGDKQFNFDACIIKTLETNHDVA